MQKQISIPAKNFDGRGLVYQLPGMFSKGRVMDNGLRVVGRKGAYVLQDNDGKSVELKLKKNLLLSFVDPIPTFELEGEEIALAPPLKWHERVWIGLPFSLVFVGGALGGLLGIGVALANGRIFRWDIHPAVKYVLVGLMGILAVVAYVILASIFLVATGEVDPTAIGS